MELLRRWGLEAKAWERSIDVEWQAWACPTLAEADQGQPVEVGLPTRGQAALVSPTSPACLPQDELEPMLEEHLGSFGSVRLERGVQLLSLAREADGGHELTLRAPASAAASAPGTWSAPTASEAGCGGARHRVGGRHATRRTARGTVRAPLWEVVRDHRYGIYFLGDGSSFIPAGKPDRWVFAVDRDAEAGEGER
jgi:hypothetical protein